MKKELRNGRLIFGPLLTCEQSGWEERNVIAACCFIVSIDKCEGRVGSVYERHVVQETLNELKGMNASEAGWC